MPLAEERALAERARDHDQEAFMALVKDAHNRIWGVCLGITSNRHDAEDAMQEAITTAWQGIGRFRMQSRFSTWLYQIAANICRNKVSRRREYPDWDTGADVAAGGTEPGERVAAAQTVRWAVSQLSDDFREAIVLREVADLSYKEIALQQGVSIQTVKSRLHRAKAAMQKLLSEEVV